MKIAFLHPDLGIGGAERLVVDAALGLQRLGHTVHIYTSYHDPNHCFEETRDGTLTVRYIRPPLPRSLRGKGHILFAHLRQLHLTFHILSSGKASAYDVYFVDQLSTCIPLLRGLAQKRVVFYGHFPDKLLADGQFVEGETGHKKNITLKGLYRIPMDWLEEATTRQTDILLANSKFTARVFKTHFPTLRQQPRVVYPGINIKAYLTLEEFDRESIGDVFSYVFSPSAMDNEISRSTAKNRDRPTLVSLNRFEKKKNAALAVEAFALVRSRMSSQNKERGYDRLRLVLAGGFDPRLQDNKDTVTQLISLCNQHSLSYAITPPTPLFASQSPPTANPDVTLVLNFSTTQRTWLLTSSTTLALLYTPTNEHFGIIPVEGMISRLPVLACNSGGPTESVVDPDFLNESKDMRTGWLRPPEPEAWCEAIIEILSLSQEERRDLGDRARQRAETTFSLDATAKSLEAVLQEAVDLGRVPSWLFYWFMCILSLIVALLVILWR